MAKKYLNDTDAIEVGNGLIFKSDAILTPSTITADEDDYNPTGMIVSGSFVKTILRVSSTGANSITGIVAPPAGENASVYICNVGSGNITLQDSDTGSVAENRFLFNGNTILAGEEGVHVWYDHVSQRWREFARAI